MKLQNKKTGQLGNFIMNKDHFECVDLDYVPEYRNLAELNEEWEDVSEEQKRGWYIDLSCNDILVYKDLCVPEELSEKLKQIGNYFETKEEAEQAVEKLKAWKRLEDKGLRFRADGIEVFSEGLLEIDGVLPALEGADDAERSKIVDDLYLLFGGEE